ncbi:MAG: prenyltransferase/squalene oxidase repeat-containing protein [Mangrovibacterium sp.]
MKEMQTALQAKLLAKQSSKAGLWTGELSSSAISTSVAVFALHMVDAEKHKEAIDKGADWLFRSMKANGSWGDSIESPPNMTATLLSYVALCAIGKAPQQAHRYLEEQFGGLTDTHIINGVLAYYGKDLTFSAPILVMCALAGIISTWENIPQLPFELAVMPQRFFRFLRLPVVSYAIPALIAVGILRFQRGRKGIWSGVRRWFVPKSLRVLERLQPSHGGFLEAAPLTGFVAMCMSGAGYKNHVATQKGVDFLLRTVRADGSWTIDTNLASWVTVLSVRALGDKIPNKQALAETIKANAFKEKHPFTGAKEGGWGWTDLEGAAPDADDTAGSLVALHHLLDGNYAPEVGKGIEWLLWLQNKDGGIPTFCKGWGKLPFDRSSPDITAHALLAMHLWQDALPATLQAKCQKGTRRMLRWMKRVQAADGSWTPLWFGDQKAADEKAPVYGTAMAVEYLSGFEKAETMCLKGMQYLLSAQNADGGWGGAAGVPSKVTFTARALSALASFPQGNDVATTKAADYLYQKYQAGELLAAEPIGLYFARLWYSEELYNITFVLQALNKYKIKIA